MYRKSKVRTIYAKCINVNNKDGVGIRLVFRILGWINVHYVWVW